MINGQKYHRFNNPTLTQGGWVRTGVGNDYIERITDISNPTYYTRIATIEYIPDVTTNKIKIFAYENVGLPMDVSLVALRNDNYILESLSWQENGSVFSISVNYDKLGVMFRYQNGSAISPSNITGIRVTNWFDTPIPTRKLHNKTDIITSLPADLYADGQPIGANLFDKNWLVEGYTLDFNTGLPSANEFRIATISPVDVSDVTQIIVSYTVSEWGRDILFIYSIFKNGSLVERRAGNNSGDTVNISDADELYLCFYDSQLAPESKITSDNLTNLMVNSGSTALPYQPYAPTIIKGNMSQTGTPTPTTPIQPSECGERTANLFDYTTTTDGYEISLGNILPNADWCVSDYIPVDAGKTYYGRNTGGSVVLYDSQKNKTRGVGGLVTLGVTADTNEAYIRINSAIVNKSIAAVTVDSKKPYEPYGYKIPILSASTTTPVYLGEVQTTRKIKKYEFTGNELYYAYNYSGTSGVQVTYILDSNKSRSQGYCNICPVSTSAGTAHCVWLGSGGGDRTVYFVSILSDMGMSTVDEFKSYVQQQYAAGTPITIWYVLATPTTGIVNEPIRKIGDYADSVSVTGIPTTTGKDSFDVLTTLKPSEVSLTYTGWHDSSVQEYVGGIGLNKFDEQYPDISTTTAYRPIYVGDGTFTMSSTVGREGTSAVLYFLAGNVSTGAHNSTNSVYDGQNRTQTAVDGYVTVAYRRIETLSPENYNTMLSKGSTSLPYEPYEYGWE